MKSTFKVLFYVKKLLVSLYETKIRTIGLELSYGETCCMVRVKSYPHHALTFTPTPVMPMNKGIEPMGESVRVKTAITPVGGIK